MSIASELHALHQWIDRLIGHGVPAEVIAEGKTLAGAVLPVAEKVAEPIIESAIAAEMPPALVPVADAAVQAGEHAVEAAVAP